MTISNASRTAGPFIGDGVTVNFPFSYKVFTRADVLVARTVTATGVETILALDADYTVTLNGNQNSSPGGVVVLSAALAAGTTLAMTSNIPIQQNLDLTNNGGFYPAVINDALDRIVITVQQLAAKVGAGALNVGASASIAAILTTLNTFASSTGATLVGTIAAYTGAILRTVQNKQRDFLNANDFAGVDPTGATDCTAALAAFITAAKTRYRGIEFSGVYKVSQLVLDGVRDVHFRGDVSFLGLGAGTFDCVLEIKNMQSCVFSGDCVVSGSSNPNYGAGVKIWTSATGTTSLIDLSSFTVVHAKRGFQIGDPTITGRVLSEITIKGGYTYDVPNPVIAYGTQTFINLIGVNHQSSASASFPGAEEVGVICVGANVRQTGGEQLHTASTAGSTVEIRPIQDGATAVWGSYNATGTVIETAAPLIKFTNPAGLASPQPGLASGFVHCAGYHSQNLAPFISGVAGYIGKLTMKANDFQTIAGRTMANMNFVDFPDVYCDDESFGKNFLAPLGGITGGGVLHFSQRLIFAATNLTAQALPNATQTTLKYQSLSTAGDLVRFQGQYSAATGQFTVPTGGLKNVQIVCQQKTGSITSGDLYLEINGTIVAATSAAANGIAQLVYTAPQLAAGDLIKVVLYNIASGAQVAGSSTLDFLQISASN